MDVYVARQPIFTKNKKIYGYELLFREGLSNFFPDVDGDMATSKLLYSSFFTIGVEKITGWKVAFINFTRDLLINRVPLMFPKERIVVEILEDVEPEKDLIKACQEIAGKGYDIALDDFFYKAELKPLIGLADIIKFDFRLTPLEEMAKIVKKLAEYDVNLLAEKVETPEEFKKALEMGFNYFQGYFFCKPEIIRGRDIQSSKMTLLEIMTTANKKDFRFHELEKIILRDVAISYKLLRYINSVYFRRVSNISSIKQAIVLLGEKGIRRFVSLIAMAKLASDKPDELIRTSIIRAKFCELIGKMNGVRVNHSELFTLGMFSLIDAILDDSMESLMEKLPLSEDIKNVLVHGKGKLKDYLDLTVAYEMGDWEKVSETAVSLNLDEANLPDSFMEALTWADGFSNL
jgi:EAL and modified HD-GYP domain-containing signal transduction protein